MNRLGYNASFTIKGCLFLLFSWHQSALLYQTVHKLHILLSNGTGYELQYDAIFDFEHIYAQNVQYGGSTKGELQR